MAVVLGLGYLADWVNADIPTADLLLFVLKYRMILGMMAVVLVVGLVAHVIAGRWPSSPTSRGRRSIVIVGRPGNILAVLAMAVLVVLGREYAGQANARTDADRRSAELEHALKSNGPKVLTWDWPQALHDLPIGVKNTYYRGNDERSDQLFNNGNYLTATFHVGLIDATGADVSPEPLRSGEPLAIRWEIVRGPKTANSFFSPELLRKCFCAAD